MSLLTQGAAALSFMISEGPNNHSRDEITILAGSGATRPLTAGMVLGKRTVGTASATADAGNTGNGAMGAITVTGPAKPGTHRLVVVEPGSNVGTFVVYDPDGIPGPKGVVASAYSANGLAFTLADGATDFVAGDAFSIEVVPTAFKWLQWDPEGTLGEAVAAGILMQDITAPNGSDIGGGLALVRGPVQVTAAEVDFSDADAAEIVVGKRQLAALGIIAR